MQPAAIGIIKEGDKYLLVKRKDLPIWVLPGGGIDEGETSEQALVREVEEETGLKVRIIRQSGEYTPQNKLTAPSYVFVGEVISGKAHLTEETSDVGFFSLDQFPSPFFPLHTAWIQDALNSTKTVRRPITEVTVGALLRFFLKHPVIFLGYVCRRSIP